MTGVCDSGCGEMFIIDLKTKSFQGLSANDRPDLIEKTYFVCPHCGKEYLCFYTDTKTRQLQKDIRNIDHLIRTMTGDTLKTYLRASIKRHEKIRQDIADRMYRLKEIHGD